MGFAESKSNSVGVVASMNVDYEWQRPYVEAVLETDRTKLPQRIEQAHASIQARIDELSQDHEGTPEERRAIDFALNCLMLLSKEFAMPNPQFSAASANPE
jgi:hypothetical protein